MPRATQKKVVTKALLIEQISRKTGLTKQETERTLHSLLQTIKETLRRGQTVQLIPFGRFEVRHRPPRQGRNPRTKARIQLRARRLPVFRPGKSLKEAVRLGPAPG